MIEVNKDKIRKEDVTVYLTKWERLKTDLLALHAMREETVGEDLLEGLELYYDLLQHCHNIPALKGIEIELLEALPLNGKERLEFIEKSPKQYASFKQLDELFDETNKKLARLRIQK